ncbi:MAG TPA: FtsX-like permease family protein, partial [Gemmatimonadales bacterium]|nr:FtsX-like permease family protein [Gemmatimonadales bacterium]
VPFDQMPFASSSLLVRLDGPLTSGMRRALRDAVWRWERDVPLDAMRTMDDVAAELLATPRTLGRVLLAFAGLAGLLMTLGIHGIVAQSVVQRRRDLAIRRALGATRGSVISSVVRRSAIATLVGLGLGVLLVALSAGLLRPFAVEVPPTDGTTVSLALLLLLLVAVLGALPPALRAARLSPAAVLRD